MRLFKKSHIRLYIALAILIATGMANLIVGSQKLSIESIAQASVANVAATTSKTTGNAGTAAAPASKTQPTPTCNVGARNLPPAPSAVATQPGLHANIMAPSYYTVYGNTTKEINNQVASCSPISDDEGRFAASTDYALNWAFSFEPGSDGLCHVTAASVAINISVIYPSWQETPGAASGLSKSWQQFATNLATHENGHVRINQAGAAQLQASLQGFPPASCDTILAQVTAKANSDIQAMNQANAAYDNATHHGTTQGAVLN